MTSKSSDLFIQYIEENTDESFAQFKHLLNATFDINDEFDINRKEKCIYSMKIDNGDNLLHHCVINNNYNICEYLLQIGYYYDLRNNNMETPLYDACKYMSWDIAQLLLEYDANPMYRSGLNHDTPFDLVLNCPDCPSTIIRTMEIMIEEIPLDYNKGLMLKEEYSMIKGYHYRLLTYTDMLVTIAYHNMTGNKVDYLPNDKRSLKLLSENSIVDLIVIVEKIRFAMSDASEHYCLNHH